MNHIFNPSISQNDDDSENNLNILVFRNNNLLNSLNIFRNINSNLNSNTPNVSAPLPHQNTFANDRNNNETQFGLTFFRNNNNILDSLFQSNQQENISKKRQFGYSFNNAFLEEQKKTDEDFNNIFLPKTINKNVNNEINIQRNKIEFFPFKNQMSTNNDSYFENSNDINNVFNKSFSRSIDKSTDYKIETLFGSNNRNKNISQNNDINIQNGGLLKEKYEISNNPFLLSNDKKDFNFNPFLKNKEVENLSLRNIEHNPFELNINNNYNNNNENKIDDLNLNPKKDTLFFSKTSIFPNPFLILSKSNKHESSNPFNHPSKDNILSSNIAVSNSNSNNIKNINNDNNLKDINNKKENNIFLNDSFNYPFKINLSNQRNSVFNSDESNNNKKNFFQISSSSNNNFEIFPSYKNNLIYVKEYTNNNQKNIKVYKFETNSSDVSLEKLIFNHLESNYEKKEEKKIKENEKIELNCQINEPNKLFFTVEVEKKDEISVLKGKICEELKKGNDAYEEMEENSFCLMKNFCFVEECGKTCGDVFSDCDSVIIMLKEILKKHI